MTYAESGFYREHWRDAGVPRPRTTDPERMFRADEAKRRSKRKQQAKVKAEAAALLKVLEAMGEEIPVGYSQVERARMYRALKADVGGGV
jgi:hypothetical protein